jgi:hypothetical protein
VSGCEAYADAGGALCGELPTATVAGICVHEHLGERRYCTACAVELQRRHPIDLGCRLCHESAERPHWCHADVTIRWDSGEVTSSRDGEWVTGTRRAARC